MRVIGAGILSLVIGTNKPFENSQPYFTGYGKHYCRRYEHRGTMVIKNEHKTLYFGDDFEHMCHSTFDSFKLNP